VCSGSNHIPDNVTDHTVCATTSKRTCHSFFCRVGDSGRRIVLCAHIDAKDGTPGALDNATGIAFLLLLAELLENYSGNLGIEIVALNGEDHYSAQGQKEYVKSNEERFSEIILAINIDVAGYIQGNSAYSMYGCPDDIARLVHKAFSLYACVIEGELWYQSDHMIFVQNRVPALAITSDQFVELSTYITHTPKDSPELVDCEMIINLALALRDLLVRIE